MTRRLLLLIPLAVCLAADPEKESNDLIMTAATELSAGRADGFLGAFDPAMPGFQKLRGDVAALTSQANLECSIEVVSNEGDEAVRNLTLDWILHLGSKDNNPGSARRQKTVKCQVRKNGKKWRIVSFEPLDLFAPMG